MYAHLLSSVFEDWVDELYGDELVDYALVCREAMLAPRPAVGSACIALAAEITYDRALVKLCTSKKIKIDIMAFARPRSERARLERQLAAAGVDLVAMTRQASAG